MGWPILRLLFAIIGSVVGAALARYLAYPVGDLFQLGWEGWSWQAGVISMIFMLGAGEIAIKLFERDDADLS